MVRVPVPDDYDAGNVSVAGASDYHYGEADVNLDDVDRARNLIVREDDDGRYVGVSSEYADRVADYLGTSAEGAESPADATEENAGDGSDADDADDSGTDAPTCAGADGECSREVDEPGDKCWQHAED